MLAVLSLFHVTKARVYGKAHFTGYVSNMIFINETAMTTITDLSGPVSPSPHNEIALFMQHSALLEIFLGTERLHRDDLVALCKC